MADKNAVFSWLSSIADGAVKNALKTIYTRLNALEDKVSDIDSRVLKTGSPVDAKGQRVSNAADPVDGADVVTLDYLRRLIASGKIVDVRPPGTRIGGGTPGPTTPPTGPTNLPSGTFTVNPDILGAGGGTVTLTWSTTNTTKVELGSIFGPTEEVALNGTTTKVITDSTVYVLFLTGGSGTAQRTATVIVGGEPPPPSGPTGGVLRAVGTGFQVNGQPFDLVGCSMFTLFYDYAYGGRSAFAAQQIQAMKQTSVRVPRILVTVNRNQGWSDGSLVGYPVRLDPEERPTFYQDLARFAGMMKDQGFYPEYVVFGDCNSGFETRAIRDTVTRAVANVLRTIPCFAQIANEPQGIDIGREGDNFNAYDPADESQRLAYVYKGVDTNNPLSLWATQSVPPDSSMLTKILLPPANWAAFHSSRRTGSGKWQWITDTIVNLAVRRNGQPMPVVDDEPMCASGNPDNNQNDYDPVHWWAYGVLCQLLKIGSVFHSQELLGSRFTDPAHSGQLQAWLQGRAAVSSQQPGEEFYLTSSGSSYGQGPWASTTALTIYGRIAGGSGLALIMRIDGGFNVNASLNPGWTVTVVEQRSDALLVSVRQ